jgi:hypothetical protein
MMIRYLLILLSLSLLSFGEETSSEKETSTFLSQNVYIEYDYLPQRLYKGQIFHIILKTTVLSENYDEVIYKFIGGFGFEQLSFKPDREMIDDGGVVSVYDKFYFKSTAKRVVTPRIDIFLENSIDKGKENSLSGKIIDSIELPPTKNFSNILSKELEIYKSVANRFDEGNNILTMFIKIKEGNFENIKFEEPFIIKQGVESTERGSNFLKSEIRYYVVVPKYYDTFRLKYFNTELFKFQTLDISIDVRDDMVTTAKDLRPKMIDKNRNIKISIAVGVTFIFLMLFYFYQHYINLFFASIGVLISVSFLIPHENVCIEKDSIVRILPMLSSTGFKTIEENSIFDKIAERNGFVKIRFPEGEESEGWIKNENICKN